MKKIQNVNIFVIFAIMAVGLGALGYVTMIDKNMYMVNADNESEWKIALDKDSYSSFGNADDGVGPIIKNSSIEFNLNFLKPGDYKTYTFYMVNTGNVNNFLKEIKVVEDSINKNDISFTYSVYKGKDLILDSVNGKIIEENNHLYKNGGKNLIEVTVRYEPLNGIMNDEIVVAKYNMKLNYENN